MLIDAVLNLTWHTIFFLNFWSKSLATLKYHRIKFGDMFLMYFDLLNPNLKLICPKNFLIMRHQNCHVWLNTCHMLSMCMLACHAVPCRFSGAHSYLHHDGKFRTNLHLVWWEIAPTPNSPSKFASAYCGAYFAGLICIARWLFHIYFAANLH